MTPSEVKPLDGKPAEAANQAALRALKEGDPRAALALLQSAILHDPAVVPLRLNLAAAFRALNDIPSAARAVEEALQIDPRNFMALLMKASLLERQGKDRLAGAAYGLAVNLAPPTERLDPATQKALERARTMAQNHADALAAHLNDTLSDRAKEASPGDGRRLGAFVDRLTGRRKSYHQEPVQFSYPNLPSIEFYDPELFPWLEGLKAAAGGIKQEYLAAIERDEADAEFTPYVEYPEGVPVDQWAELNHSKRWGAYHLYKAGRPVAQHCAECPKTIEALAALPQPQSPGRSPAAMFSRLAPKTRIPAHTGISNTRLVVHLPLVAPNGCAFRVGSETRPWIEGEPWVFDDTIEHEAWNDSAKPRGVLIFDIWSPFLSEAERMMVVDVMAALDAFHGSSSESPL